MTIQAKRAVRWHARVGMWCIVERGLWYPYGLAADWYGCLRFAISESSMSPYVSL